MCIELSNSNDKECNIFAFAIYYSPSIYKSIDYTLQSLKYT